jgi:hypothetical protein
MNKFALYAFATLWNSVMIWILFGLVYLLIVGLTGGDWHWPDGQWDKVWIAFFLLNVLGWIQLAAEDHDRVL